MKRIAEFCLAILRMMVLNVFGVLVFAGLSALVFFVPSVLQSYSNFIQQYFWLAMFLTFTSFVLMFYFAVVFFKTAEDIEDISARGFPVGLVLYGVPIVFNILLFYVGIVISESVRHVSVIFQFH